MGTNENGTFAINFAPSAEGSAMCTGSTTLPTLLSQAGENKQLAAQPLQATQHTQSHQHTGQGNLAAPAAPQAGTRDNIPEELRSRAQWLLAAPHSNGGLKIPTTVSRQNGSLRPGSVTDRGTWLPFEAAYQAALNHGYGIGYVIAADDPFCCIDLDVKNQSNEPDSSKWTNTDTLQRHQKIVEKFNSYTEFSQSGQGIHVWVYGAIGRGARRDSTEVYSQERFIVCTGNVLHRLPIAERQEYLNLLVEDMRRGKDQQIALEELEEELSDDEIFLRLSGAANSNKFDALRSCTGDSKQGAADGSYRALGYQSQSEADLALMSMLSFHSKSNEQCRRLFRMTGLGKRDKAARNNVYLNRTLSVIRGRQSRELAAVAHGEKVALALLKQADHTASDAPMTQGSNIPNSIVSHNNQQRTPRDILRKVTAPPYSLDAVPSSIADLAKAYSSATGFDHSGAIVAATVAAGAVIDDRYRLAVRPESGWYESARLWAVLIGSPSAGKSPTLRAATDPLKELHVELFTKWNTENADVDENEKPPKPAIYVSDTNIDAMSESLKSNPRGLLMLTEEFSSWIGGIDSTDRGQGARNRGGWLELYDGGPRQIERIQRGSFLVPNWGASVLAACTPDGLQKQMKGLPEDGLIQRFIPAVMASPDFEAKGDSRKPLEIWSQWVKWVYHNTACSETKTMTAFSNEARCLFEKEHLAQRRLTDATYETFPSFASHLGKHGGMLARLALIFHVFSGNSAGTLISCETLETAIRFTHHVRKHASVMFNGILSASPAYDLSRSLARSIVAETPAITTVGRDWMTQHCASFKKADDRLRREAVQILEDADWLEAAATARSYGAWPSKWNVNSKVFELFAREGEQWRARRAAVRDAIGQDNAE
jgi:primase-polymerase (primpol)-like protein